MVVLDVTAWCRREELPCQQTQPDMPVASSDRSDRTAAIYYGRIKSLNDHYFCVRCTVLAVLLRPRTIRWMDSHQKAVGMRLPPPQFSLLHTTWSSSVFWRHLQGHMG
jgi:hypothetical protein